MSPQAPSFQILQMNQTTALETSSMWSASERREEIVGMGTGRGQNLGMSV